jgi:hypothetical protein
MYLCAGEISKILFFRFPADHSGIIESLAVPERMDSLPCRRFTNRLTADKRALLVRKPRCAVKKPLPIAS